jgi:hypothetical protein
MHQLHHVQQIILIQLLQAIGKLLHIYILLLATLLLLISSPARTLLDAVLDTDT